MSSKPSLPKGTRDFSPVEMSRRNRILDTIINVYKKYGFEQIETPAMENLSTLTGKYGDEGDQLLFRILNSRLHESKNKEQLLEAFKTSLEKNHNTDLLTERALRYDLTVPFARYVVMHQNEITFPLKRYQIQPVWRADRPQKGRYREFYQCDADMIGSDSLLNEAELVMIMDEVFSSLGISVSIHINNRKILAGIAEVAGVPDKLIDITVAIDKIDKIGMDQVLAELSTKGLSESSIEKIKPLLSFNGTGAEKITFLKQYLESSETGKKGIEELETVLKLAPVASVEPDITLARGLNYYTGAIFEVKAKNVSIGSITGGGRYDNLTGVFGLPGISGVGISFGIDRIYDVMEELGMFKETSYSQGGTRILFVNFGEQEMLHSLKLVQELRKSGIACELYPESAKMKKQFTYADNKRIPFVGLVGTDEMNAGTVTIKNMATGDQTTIPASDLNHYLSHN